MIIYANVLDGIAVSLQFKVQVSRYCGIDLPWCTICFLFKELHSSSKSFGLCNELPKGIFK